MSCACHNICGGQCTCTPKFSSVASKLNVVEIGKGGKPGEGIDIDGDPKTCAPKSSCTGGIDNAVGALAGIANPQLKPAIETGSVMLVVEFAQCYGLAIHAPVKSRDTGRTPRILIQTSAHVLMHKDEIFELKS